MSKSNKNKTDSEAYLAKKRTLSTQLTIFGRITVKEALLEKDVSPSRLHLSESNKPAAILQEITELAESRGAEVRYHDKLSLSRISKNAKQDQGVALDIKPKGFREWDETTASAAGEIIGLDGITNPQNLGMIIRSVCASESVSLLLPRKGCAHLDALVIKASAGTLFRAPIYRCDSIVKGLKIAEKSGYTRVGLDLQSKTHLHAYSRASQTMYVLGNESEGISKEVRALCSETARIPMANHVESLNVAVTASLIALRHQL